MSKSVKILLSLLLLVGAIQFFGPDRPGTSTDNQDDLLQDNEIAAEVKGLLKTSCYDCHSMETQYPWYSYAAPFSWLIFDHINDGREELNFSQWNTYPKRTKIRKLKDIGEEVEEGEMPLESYLWMHSDAKLSKEQVELILNWTKEYSLKVMKE